MSDLSMSTETEVVATSSYAGDEYSEAYGADEVKMGVVDLSHDPEADVEDDVGDGFRRNFRRGWPCAWWVPSPRHEECEEEEIWIEGKVARHCGRGRGEVGGERHVLTKPNSDKQ